MPGEKLVFLPGNGPFRDGDFNSEGKDSTRSFTMLNLKRESESIRTRNSGGT